MVETRPLKGNHRHTRAYIGLGSNSGDRVGFVQQAMQFFKDVANIRVVECSSLYETEPIGNNTRKSWFVNAVAAIDTSLSAEELLQVCQEIERRLTLLHAGDIAQSEAAHKNSPRERIIDLDILFFGDHVVENQDLCVPHPKVTRRAYALVPLLEIAPELLHPSLNRTVTQLHEQLPNPELVFLYGTRGERR